MPTPLQTKVDAIQAKVDAQNALKKEQATMQGNLPTAIPTQQAPI